MKLSHECPKCNKPAIIQAEFPMGNLVNYIYKCGHLELRSKLNLGLDDLKAKIDYAFPQATETKEIKKYPYNSNIADYFNWLGLKPEEVHHSFKSVDKTKTAYKFQIEGIKFSEKAELNCLIADAMGLGKTIQALLAIARNKVITLPCLIIVKGATLFQWQAEYRSWVNKDFTSCMPITNRMHIVPGFEFYILSMDMLSKQDIQDKLATLNLKSVIIDEVQNFKDQSAKRTKGLINLIKNNNIKYKIALSGTPIKNRASEYFTILNLLAPSHFWSYDEFKKYWLIQNEKGVYSRINPLKLDKFKELTNRWIIRRERHEVLTNLPPLTRDYQLIDIDDVNIKNTYNRTLDLFKNWLNDNKSGAQSTQLLGWLAQLRSITGQAKCKNALEWIQDFLESTDESLAVGIHHTSVRDTLYYILDSKNLKPLKLSGEDSVYRKSDIVRKFTNGESRILVINSLAGGVGLNLQTCANALILERQWNSADEEQFESRFHRDGQKQAVTCTYMIAKGTIDEFFHELVLNKRKIFNNTMGSNSWDLTSDMDSLLEFSNQVVNHKI